MISLNGGPESFPDDIMQKVSFIYAEPITTTTGISIGSILMRGYGASVLPGWRIQSSRVILISTPAPFPGWRRTR